MAKIKSVERQGSKITTLITEDGQQYAASVFVDGSYEGDLIGAANISFSVGRVIQFRSSLIFIITVGEHCDVQRVFERSPCNKSGT